MQDLYAIFVSKTVIMAPRHPAYLTSARAGAFRPDSSACASPPWRTVAGISRSFERNDAIVHLT
jgi:hypothetical protein